MTARRLDVTEDLLTLMADNNNATIHAGRGRRWIVLRHPYTGHVLRVVASRPSITATARTSARVEVAAACAEAGYVPEQRKGGEGS